MCYTKRGQFEGVLPHVSCLAPFNLKLLSSEQNSALDLKKSPLKHEIKLYRAHFKYTVDRPDKIRRPPPINKTYIGRDGINDNWFESVDNTPSAMYGMQRAHCPLSGDL